MFKARNSHAAGSRAQCKNAKWLTPFEVVLRTDENGTDWQTRPMRWEQMKLAFEMFNSGIKYGEVAQNLGMERTKAYRLHKKWKESSASAASAITN